MSSQSHVCREAPRRSHCATVPLQPPQPPLPQRPPQPLPAGAVCPAGMIEPDRLCPAESKGQSPPRICEENVIQLWDDFHNAHDADERTPHGAPQFGEHLSSTLFLYGRSYIRIRTFRNHSLAFRNIGYIVHPEPHEL